LSGDGLPGKALSGDALSGDALSGDALSGDALSRKALSRDRLVRKGLLRERLRCRAGVVHRQAGFAGLPRVLRFRLHLTLPFSEPTAATVPNRMRAPLHAPPK
ncbi:hypothetical protein ACFQ07_04650, partial [Actinomadura adrarensis]